MSRCRFVLGRRRASASGGTLLVPLLKVEARSPRATRTVGVLGDARALRQRSWRFPRRRPSRPQGGRGRRGVSIPRRARSRGVVAVTRADGALARLGIENDSEFPSCSRAVRVLTGCLPGPHGIPASNKPGRSPGQHSRATCGATSYHTSSTNLTPLGRAAVAPVLSGQLPYEHPPLHRPTSPEEYPTAGPSGARRVASSTNPTTPSVAQQSLAFSGMTPRQLHAERRPWLTSSPTRPPPAVTR